MAAAAKTSWYQRRIGNAALAHICLSISGARSSSRRRAHNARSNAQAIYQAANSVNIGEA